MLYSRCERKPVGALSRKVVCPTFLFLILKNIFGSWKESGWGRLGAK